MPPRFPRGLPSLVRASRPQVATPSRAVFQQLRTHTTRDRYFLRPLRNEAPSPTFDYKFLSQPASVEVSRVSPASCVPSPPLPAFSSACHTRS